MGYKDINKRREWDRVRHAKSAEKFRQYMESMSCTDCHRSFDWWMLEWDHVPERGIKLINIGAIAHKDISNPRLANELQKCDLVCANCHTTRTHKRQCTSRDCNCKLEKVR